eukprot:UN04436
MMLIQLLLVCLSSQFTSKRSGRNYKFCWIL